uniref:Small integral membrane protein 12 n=1 Tax=Acrobeloides nanus TaxID=290746 RepID=A0A914EI74_9BILA
MWQVIIQRLSQQWVRYIVLPVAMVVGGIGVYAEGKLLPKKKPLPYLEHSRVEERINRLLEEDMSPETKSLAEEKSRMVPKSSLLVNQAGKRVYPAQS